HQFGLGEFGKKWTYGQRSFSLAHENTGSHIEGFRAACTHDSRHQPRGGADDELHHPEVIENSKEGGNKEDCGEYLEGKRKAEPGRPSSREPSSRNRFRRR